MVSLYPPGKSRSTGFGSGPEGPELEHCFSLGITRVPRSQLPSTEHCAERSEQPNIARCSHRFGTDGKEPVRLGCSVRHRDQWCCSARDAARELDYSRAARVEIEQVGLENDSGRVYILVSSSINYLYFINPHAIG